MSSSALFLNASDAASRLGVSVKALRLYEQRGLLAPLRSEAGWRAYSCDDMARAAEIVALRELGLSLGQVARVLGGDIGELDAILSTHQASLERQVRRLGRAIDKVRGLRTDLAAGRKPPARELASMLETDDRPSVAFALPWPWGGEMFELRDIRPLTYITGPLGSGKTRLARRLAETLPDAVFLGLERMESGGQAVLMRLDADPLLRQRVDTARDWLVDDGATASQALMILLALLESDDVAIKVVDMVEQDLDQATQQALAAYLRHRRTSLAPLVLMTRSSAILDMAAMGDRETIIYCPANHSPPICVAPIPGSAGFEAVSTCLATPEVRARTQGVIAWLPHVA